jgi:hypothetical protein
MHAQRWLAAFYWFEHGAAMACGPWVPNVYDTWSHELRVQLLSTGQFFSSCTGSEIYLARVSRVTNRGTLVHKAQLAAHGAE